MKVLMALTATQPSMSLTELAEATDTPLSTTHRLAAQLCRWGALERRADRYYVGPQMERLASLAVGRRELRELTMPFMQDLFAATNENIQLTVPDGARILCLEKVRGHKSITTTTRVGTHRLLHSTSSGKLFLAFSNRNLFASVVADGLERCTQRTITLPGVLAESIRTVRENQIGYAFEETALGVSAVAAPVFAADGSVVASLSVVAPSSTDIRAFRPLVGRAADGASRLLAASDHRVGSPKS